MKKFFRWLSRPWLILILILLLGLALRLYKIDIPLADHHSWRQADTAAVARNFIKEEFNFFKPRIDNLAPLHPGRPNSGRLFLVEPPVYQSIVAVFYRFLGVRERWARLVSIAFSLGAIGFLYFLTSRLAGKRIALLASFFMAVLPYSFFYSRVILPEPMMLFASLGMLYFFSGWMTREKKRGKRARRDGILACFFAAWALALKTFPLFLALPMLFLVWRRWKLNFWKQKGLWLFFFFSVLPLVLWRVWVSRFPEGVPAFEWLLNSGGIRFRPAFFRWLFAERIGKIILGYWGLPLFVLGLILKPEKKEGWFFHWWLVAFLVYLMVFASGNVTHDYYQIPFVPLAAVFLAKGTFWLLFKAKKDYHQTICYLLFAICFFFMLGFSWFEVRGFYLIQGGVDLAGLAVDELTPKDALILTGDTNDATLLYNCNRYGWTGGYASYFPNTPETVEEVRRMGASVYVTTKVGELKSSDFGQFMYREFPVIKETDQFAVFDLSRQ